MKAVVKTAPGPGNVQLIDWPEPACGPGLVKIEVSACGICGTDLHVLHDTFRNYPPVVLGHEFAGPIVEIGAGVRGIERGRRYCVLGATTVTCGRCGYCRAGEFMFCPERRGMGHGVSGAFTRYVVARPDQLFLLPDNLPTEEGALVEPFAAAVHAVCDLARLRSGDVALVSGPGPIGLLCTKLLVAAGLKTIVAGAGTDGDRLALAGKMGATVLVDVSRDDLAAMVRDQTDGLGVDLAFECSGAAASAGNCLRAMRPLGQYVQVGHFGRDITLPFDLVAFRQIHVQGSVGYTEATWRRALAILAEGRVRLSDLITHRLPLDRWEEGFALAERRAAGKVLLLPTT
jgi:L-iditol 2-dehydrogenase